MVIKRTPSTRPTGNRLVGMLLSWLIPGYGFFIHGRRKRAIFFFLALQATFLVGVAFRGIVLVPDFRIASEGFNIVSILTFFTQIWNGGLALLSMLPELFGPHAALLSYDEANQWADLGNFFLLISGGLNYVVLTSTWDMFYSSTPKAQQPATELPS